ncbi:hypothetical protein L1049_024851 [Liquidambar formosana]|uniref:Uncharacterized protein n=1 Tax=Liquidambar formosana TaxID=63359 RepID=A0AAP0X012_LIQFO
MEGLANSITIPFGSHSSPACSSSHQPPQHFWGPFDYWNSGILWDYDCILPCPATDMILEKMDTGFAGLHLIFVHGLNA